MLRTLKLAGTVLALGLLSAWPAQAFEGLYRVSGQTNDGRGYDGMAQVSKTGDTYTVLWLIGNERHLGTGILTGGQLAVVFAGGGVPGIAVYRQTTGEEVVGIYTQLGSTETAIETWTPEEQQPTERPEAR